MILQALTAYYEAQHRKGKISDVGWDDRFKVSFLLEIDDTGALIDMIDNRELTAAGKKQMLLPQPLRPHSSTHCPSGMVRSIFFKLPSELPR